MPKSARAYEDRYYYGDIQRNSYSAPRYGRYPDNTVEMPHRHSLKRKKRSKKADKDVLLARILGLSFIGILAFGILPCAFKSIANSIFTKSPYPSIKADYNKIVFPTLNYLNNNVYMGKLSLNGAATGKKALMAELPLENKMSDLEISISNILPMFPSIQPTVFVWDYDTANYVDINGDKLFSAASIIKLPVLIQLFKSIEAKQVKLYDRMVLTDYYRAEGSGNLQFKAENSMYSLDKLAQVMITDSDNSATNMIMSKIGSMTDVNQGVRDWGLKHTQVHTWLPDYNGTNYTTARDLARLLYNIENPKFLSDSSRERILYYMSNVKNNRLIPAGLGEGASIIHKTGDIGRMLGDAGVVTTPNGKKYIVIIMVNRPYNAPEGKDFIVKASEIIYDYMVVK